MKKQQRGLSFLVSLGAYGLTLLVTFLIEAPHPFLASFVVGFLVFEIVYYYYVGKERQSYGYKKSRKTI